MLAGPLVFVDIDTQRDFLEPTGALFIAGSEAIFDNLARLTKFALSKSIPVLATACSHLADDEEFSQFGPHCLADSPGQERLDLTRWEGEGGRVIGPSGAFFDEIVPHLTLEKRDLDVFSHPEADRVVRFYQDKLDGPTFVVYGVATDYCVKAAVLGLLERGVKVAVVVDAVRAIDAEREAEVFAEFVRRGALLTLTEVVCDDEMPSHAR